MGKEKIKKEKILKAEEKNKNDKKEEKEKRRKKNKQNRLILWYKKKYIFSLHYLFLAQNF